MANNTQSRLKISPNKPRQTSKNRNTKGTKMKKENKEENLSLSKVREIFKGAYARYFQEEHRREGVVFNSLDKVGMKEKDQLLIMQSVRGKVLNLIPSVYSKVDALLFNELEKDAELKAQKRASIVFEHNEIIIIKEIFEHERKLINETPYYYQNLLFLSDVDKKIRDKTMLKVNTAVQREGFVLTDVFERICMIISPDKSVVEMSCGVIMSKL